MKARGKGERGTARGATPDQDVVGEIGRALGVEQESDDRGETGA